MGVRCAYETMLSLSRSEILSSLKLTVRSHRGVGVACGARRTWERGRAGNRWIDKVHQQFDVVNMGFSWIFLEMSSGTWTVGKEDHGITNWCFACFFEVCISSSLFCQSILLQRFSLMFGPKKQVDNTSSKNLGVLDFWVCKPSI